MPLTVLLIILQTSVFAADEDAANTFDSLYGASLKRVRATPQSQDDVALAIDLMSAAEIVEDAALLTLICDNAYALCESHADGFATAIFAMKTLAKDMPEKKSGCLDRIATIRHRQLVKSPGSEKASAAQRYANALVALAKSQESDGKIEEAIRSWRRTAAPALRLDLARRKEILNIVSALQAKQRVVAKIDELKSNLTKDPGDTATARELAVMYVAQLDDPKQAAVYADQTGDKTLANRVERVNQDVMKLDEKALIDLGDWYRGLAGQSKTSVTSKLLSRAWIFYRRYLQLHTDTDIVATRVRLSLKNIERELKDAGVDPPTMPGVIVKRSVPTPHIPQGHPGDLRNGLVLHYSFEPPSIESQTVKDMSGKGHDGRLKNVTFVDGPYGRAARFNGKASVMMGNPDSLQFNGPFSIAAWVRPFENRPHSMIASHGPIPSPKGEVALRLTDGRYQFYTWGHKSAGTNAPGLLQDMGRWTHIAGVYDGKSWNLFRNGKNIASNAFATPPTRVEDDWAIGSAGNGSDRFFAGDIDEVRFYKRALGANELQQLVGGKGTPDPRDREKLRVVSRDGWVDLVATIDAERDGWRGLWRRRGHEVELSNPEPYGRLRVPVLIDGDYELKIEFFRLRGDGSMGIILPVGTRSTVLQLEGWAENGFRTGLSTINGRTAKDNITTVRGRLMETLKRHFVHIEVKRQRPNARIRVKLDGKQIIDWTGDERQLDYEAGYSLHGGHLGVGGYKTMVRYAQIRLRMINGTARQYIVEPGVVDGHVNPANNHTYLLVSPTSWTSAEKLAKSLGGHLAAINNNEENEWVRRTFAQVRGMWIGLNDRKKEGEFVWSNGDPLTFQKWFRNEPNNYDEREHWVAMFVRGYNGAWNDSHDGATFFGFPVWGLIELNRKLAPNEIDRVIRSEKLQPTPNTSKGTPQGPSPQ